MFQKELAQLLQQLPIGKFTHGGKEIQTRCSVCGDSRHIHHGHMYINLGFDDTPLYYNCVRCHRNQGLVTPETLLGWGLNPSPSLCEDIIKYNRKVLHYSSNKKFVSSKTYNVSHYKITDNKLSKIKLKYINDRLGLNLKYSDMIENKIILNLFDLFSINNINTYSQPKDILNQLNNFFIGFLSEDNAFINSRCIIKNPKKMEKYLNPRINRRYTEYSIFNKFDFSRNNYVIPTDINILNKSNVKINIAEGQFDILSVFFNLKNEERTNNVYSAISGNNYLSLCSHFLTMLGLPNLEYHIYIDNDINRYSIKLVEEFCNKFMFPLYIHNNEFEGEKDFGVPLNRIKENITKLC